MIDRKFNVIMLLFGLVGGAAGHFLGRAAFALNGPKPLQAALYMGAVGLCAVLFCVLAETLFPVVNGMNWKRHYAGITWRYLVPAALLPMLLLGAVFQLIYQTDFNKQKGRDVYMLIDRSGSMEWNDPQNERLAAAARLVESFDPNDKVEIIVFDHEAEVVQPLIDAEESRGQVAAQLALIEPRGGTDFNAVLTLTHAQIEGRASQNRESVVILVSDGESEMNDAVLSSFVNRGIPVNTVGMQLEIKDGEAVLSDIARRTGGQFILTNETGQLDLAFNQIYQTEERFILDPKTRMGVDILQWLMYLLAGLLIGLAAGFIFDNRYILWPLAIGGAIGGALAGAMLCLPMDLLLPAMALGGFYTLFTLFSRTPPLSMLQAAGDTENGSFLKPETRAGKTHGRF